MFKLKLLVVFSGRLQPNESDMKQTGSHEFSWLPVASFSKLECCGLVWRFRILRPIAIRASSTNSLQHVAISHVWLFFPVHHEFSRASANARWRFWIMMFSRQGGRIKTLTTKHTASFDKDVHCEDVFRVPTANVPATWMKVEIS